MRLNFECVDSDGYRKAKARSLDPINECVEMRLPSFFLEPPPLVGGESDLFSSSLKTYNCENSGTISYAAVDVLEEGGTTDEDDSGLSDFFHY